MAKIIAVTNQKGGVGKTTSCINLAAGLCQHNKRVLLIDFDPQGNATMGSGINKNKLQYTLADVLLDNTIPLTEAIADSPNGYKLLPSNSMLTSAEVSLLEHPNKEHCLRLLLQKIQGDFDYVVIDCPPSLNMLTVNALVAADSVIIPVQCEYYALEGLASLIKTIEGIRKTANHNLKIEGLLRTMYDSRNRLAIQVSEQLLSYFGSKIYNVAIPRNVRLAEAPSHGLSIFNYNAISRGAAAYNALVEEFLSKQPVLEEA